VRRTILGGAEAPTGALFPICAVLLTSGSKQYRNQQVEHLLANGFSDIITLEEPGENFLLEDFARRFPTVKFMLLHEPVTTGEMINTAAMETDCPWLLVLRDRLRLGPQLLGSRFVLEDDNGPLCVAPRLLSKASRALPVDNAPVIDKKRFTVLTSPTVAEGARTLYPYDFIGLYHRQKLLDLGGFDRAITAPYWQLLDFSLRAFLWGEEIRLSARLQFQYDTPGSDLDVTVNASYLRFYLKNIAPVLRTDGAHIPGGTFWSYWRRSRLGLFAAKSLFAEGRRWVDANRTRFQSDVDTLAATWSSPPDEQHP
jgi:hypothetical protein